MIATKKWVQEYVLKRVDEAETYARDRMNSANHFRREADDKLEREIEQLKVTVGLILNFLNVEQKTIPPETKLEFKK